MRTLFLLATATFAVTAATAQQRNSSVVFNDEISRARATGAPEQITVTPKFDLNRKRTLANARTTSGSGGRWYNYGDYLASGSAVGFSAVYLWNDTTSIDAYMGDHSSTIYKFNDMASVGYVCDPFYVLWNDEATYAGAMKLTPSENYVIDSVYISGIYMRNNAKTAPVDTLTVAVIYGDGSANSDLHYKAIDTTGGRSWIYSEYGVDTLYYMNMKHDSINNHVDTFMGGFPPVVKKIYLTNTDTASAYETIIPLSINVPAGNMPAVSVSFKSGDPTFTFGDTVFLGGSSSNPYKYGMFRPLVTYGGTSSSPAFPINTRMDMNEGQYRDMGYDRVPNGLYRPHWFWYNASTNGAATNQYPYFAFHLSCPTCTKVGVTDAAKSVKSSRAYPNPANNEVMISYDAAGVSKATVVLTNVLGQQVAIQQADNTDGIVTFNTANLANGVYLYTVSAGSTHSSGRIVVSH